MAQHLPQSAVLICQLVDAVVVGVQAQSQYAEDKDSPLLHPRATRASIGLAAILYAGRNDFPQYRKDSLAQRWFGVDVLQSTQNLRNVVTRFRVQMNRANVDTVKHQLWIDYVAHVLFVRRSFGANDDANAPMRPGKIENTWEIDVLHRLWP